MAIEQLEQTEIKTQTQVKVGCYPPTQIRFEVIQESCGSQPNSGDIFLISSLSQGLNPEITQLPPQLKRKLLWNLYKYIIGRKKGVISSETGQRLPEEIIKKGGLIMGPRETLATRKVSRWLRESLP